MDKFELQIAKLDHQWLTQRELPTHLQSDFIHNFAELILRQKVILVACVSWKDRQANLIDQLDNLRQQARSAGAVVVGSFWYVGQRYDSRWFKRVALLADRKRADWIMAETADRFARHPEFDCMTNQYVYAEQSLLRALQRMSHDRLMTHLDADAPYSRVHAYQVRRGMHSKGNMGGRPKKIRYRKRFRELPNKTSRVIRLRDDGCSWREISALVGRSRSTVRGWYSSAKNCG